MSTQDCRQRITSQTLHQPNMKHHWATKQTTLILWNAWNNNNDDKDDDDHDDDDDKDDDDHDDDDDKDDDDHGVLQRAIDRYLFALRFVYPSKKKKKSGRRIHWYLILLWFRVRQNCSHSESKRLFRANEVLNKKRPTARLFYVVCDT
jgi:hypothetical protein